MPQTYTIEHELDQKKIQALRGTNKIIEYENEIVRYRGIEFSNDDDTSDQNRLLILPGLMRRDERRSENRVYINMRNPKAAPPKYIENVFYYRDSKSFSESSLKPKDNFVLVLARSVLWFEVEKFLSALIREHKIDNKRKDVLLFFPTDRLLRLKFVANVIEEFPFS